MIALYSFTTSQEVQILFALLVKIVTRGHIFFTKKPIKIEARFKRQLDRFSLKTV